MKLFKKGIKPEGKADVAAPGQDWLPDELPSLASEIVETKKREAVSPEERLISEKEDKPEEEPPEELPSLEKPEEIPTAEEPTQVTEQLATEKPEKAELRDDESFFQEILERINENRELSSNILDEMKAHWEGMRKDLPEIKPPTEVELEGKINTKIAKLKELEKEWVKRKDELMGLQKSIKSLELEITLKSEELRELTSARQKVKSIEKTYADDS